MALNNTGGDVISIVKPNNFGNASFSIGYGYTINAGYQTPSVSIGNVGAASNAYLSDSNYFSAGSWKISTVPANETPGSPNGGINTIWINAMRRQVPSIIIPSAATPVCYNVNAQTTSLNYSATTNSPTNYSIQWNAWPVNTFTSINSAILFSGSITITIPPGAAPGIYTGNITVSNATGISCSKSFFLTINSAPVVAASANIPVVCTNGNGAVLTASGASTYNWLPSAGLSSTTGESVIANPASTTTYTVTGTDGNGCSNTASITIDISEPPAPPTVKITQPNCIVATGTITITSPAGSDYSYSIDGNNYQSSNVFSGVALGIYQVSASNNYGCVSNNVPVNIKPPAVAIMQTIDSSGCEMVTYNGTVYTSSTVLYETVPSLATGCDSILRTIRIAVHPKPELTVSPNKTICKGDSAILTASSSDATIEWPGIANKNSITVMPALKTVYTAQATSAKGCTNTATVTVDVQHLNLLLFANPNPVIAGTVTHLQTSAGLPYQVLAWQPFSFTNPTGTNQNLVADSTTKVVVIAKSLAGCRDTASVKLLVDPIGKNIFIPSAFTPNGDGKNDVFRVLGGEIKELDMKVFNRWGQLIFSTHERAKGWDGTYNGEAQPLGIYVYVVKLVSKDGTVINKKGTVVLIK